MRRTTSLHCVRAAIDAAQAALTNGDAEGTLRALDNAKRTPDATASDVDVLRAQAFLLKNDPMGARQALLENLRWFPGKAEARELLLHVNGALAPMLDLPADVAAKEPEFAMVYDGIRDHTMLTWPRLLSLFSMVRSVCREGVAGDIVECGVAGGGSTVLLGVALRLFGEGKGAPSRRIFACDTFAGMPPPTSRDVLAHGGDLAAETHWATGTCSGSPDHLERLAAHFGISVTPLVGLFSDTLPTLPTDKVAVFHLDADWFESTDTALRSVYPKIAQGGMMQVDDYGYWSGCREAVDAFLDAAQRSRLQPVDGSAVTLSIRP